MIYIKLSIDALTDPKLMKVGATGFAMYTKGLLVAKQQQLDGVVPDELLLIVGADSPNPQETAENLVRVGLWHRIDGGYSVGSAKWSEYQVNKEQALTAREDWRARKRKQRNAGRTGWQGDEDGNQAECPEKCLGNVSGHVTHVTPQTTDHRPQTTDLLLTDKEVVPKSKRRKAKEVGDHPRWAEFHDAYPKPRQEVFEAKGKFSTLIEGGVDPDAIIDGANRYARSSRVADGYVAMMTTWLNNRRWLDEYIEAAPATTPLFPRRTPLEVAR